MDTKYKLPKLSYHSIFVLSITFIFLTSLQIEQNIHPLSHPDALTIHKMAEKLIETAIIQEPEAPYFRAWRPPGIILLTAAIYKIFGEKPEIIIEINKIAASISCAVLFYILIQLTRNYILGYLFLGLFFLFYYIENFTFLLLGEQIHLFFLSFALAQTFFYTTTKKNKNIYFGFVALALASIFKAYLFYFPFLVYILILFLLFFNFISTEIFFTFQKGILLFFLILSPFLIRKIVIIGDGSALVSYTGYNLFLGNYSLSQGQFLNPTNHKYYQEINTKINHIYKSAVSEKNCNKMLKKETFAIIKQNKTKFLLKSLIQGTRHFALRPSGADLNSYLGFFISITALCFCMLGLSRLKKLNTLCFLFIFLFFIYNFLIFGAAFSGPRLNAPILLFYPFCFALGFNKLKI